MTFVPPADADNPATTHSLNKVLSLQMVVDGQILQLVLAARAQTSSVSAQDLLLDALSGFSKSFRPML